MALINSEQYLPGLRVFIKHSPIKNPSYPYAIKSTTTFGSSIPLSDTLTKSLGISAANDFDTATEVSKVLRFLLLTPNKSI